MKKENKELYKKNQEFLNTCTIFEKFDGIDFKTSFYMDVDEKENLIHIMCLVTSKNEPRLNKRWEQSVVKMKELNLHDFNR